MSEDVSMSADITKLVNELSEKAKFVFRSQLRARSVFSSGFNTSVYVSWDPSACTWNTEIKFLSFKEHYNVWRFRHEDLVKSINGLKKMLDVCIVVVKEKGIEVRLPENETHF